MMHEVFLNVTHTYLRMLNMKQIKIIRPLHSKSSSCELPVSYSGIYKNIVPQIGSSKQNNLIGSPNLNLERQNLSACANHLESSQTLDKLPSLYENTMKRSHTRCAEGDLCVGGPKLPVISCM